jgi:hypothetical protein
MRAPTSRHPRARETGSQMLSKRRTRGHEGEDTRDACTGGTEAHRDLEKMLDIHAAHAPCSAHEPIPFTPTRRDAASAAHVHVCCCHRFGGVRGQWVGYHVQ